MRLYIVSSIDSWTMTKVQPRAGKVDTGKSVPRLGKNGGPLCSTSGMISSLQQCRQFAADKRAAGVVSVSKIRKWKGN